jgi:hypothetical protein
MSEMERSLREIIKVSSLRAMHVLTQDRENSLLYGKQLEELINDFLIKYNKKEI